MEPIDASLATSSSLGLNPFANQATMFIFGNGNNPSSNANQTPTSSATATSALGGPAESNSQTGPGALGQAAAASGSSPFNLTTILLMAVLAVLFFRKQ